MHIAQFLFAPAGQTDRDTQIPVVEWDESIVPPESAFDVVFLDQEKPSKVMELPIAVMIEPSPQEEKAQIQNGDAIPAPDTPFDMTELPAVTPKLAGDLRRTLPELTVASQRMPEDYTRGDVDLAKPLSSANTVPDDGVSARPEPDSASLAHGTDVSLARSVVAVDAPQDVGDGASDVAEAEMSKPVVEGAADAPVSALLTPDQQAPKAIEHPQAPAEKEVSSAGQARSEPRSMAGMVHDALLARKDVMPGPSLLNQRPAEPGVAATFTRVLDHRAGADIPRSALERPTESVASHREKNPVPMKSESPRNVSVTTPKPVDAVQPQSIPAPQAEDAAPNGPAPSLASGSDLKTAQAPDMMKHAPMPVSALPLIFTVEQEAERPGSDEAGFRVVDQVSQTSADLKPAAIARGAELPRMVMAQIAEIVRQQPDRPVELTLSPEELGRLRMSFQTEGSAMHVVLSFERPDTLDLMRRHIDQLAQDMRELGMSDVSFTFQQQTSEGGNGAHSDDDTATPSQHPQFDPQDAPEDPLPSALNIAGRAGVDIRV
ncbi:flagellar hook-length control protein FliK [Aliiroseovarius marinus]|uniref:flagellar hook-length control protein FliK n=1 Tax=Aliiroseovarius marinus TaxID=2500159 RepID=UPI0024952771|nr:flagellar hook-length control protein FliK [Aliiroseovarius marinus]